MKNQPAGEPTDYRKQHSKSERTLAWAVVVFLVGVGGTLITLIYGAGPAVLGVACLMGGSAIFGLAWLIITLLGRWAGE